MMQRCPGPVRLEDSPAAALVYAQEAISDTVLLTRQYAIANVDGTNTRFFASPSGLQAQEAWYIGMSPNGQSILISANGYYFTVGVDRSDYRVYGGVNAAGGQIYNEGVQAANGPVWLPDSSGFDAISVADQGQTPSDPFIARYLLSTPVSSGGYVPGTQVVPEVQNLAGMP